MRFVNSSLRAVLAAALFFWTGAAVHAGPALAVFEFELIDTSLDGEMRGTTDAERKRLSGMANQLRQALRDKNYAVVEIAAVADKAANANLQSCGMCDAAFAREVGATHAITGTVQKVSNLILNINLYVREAESRKLLAAMSADIRSNSDESWSRGLSWLIRNRLLKTLEAIAP